METVGPISIIIHFSIYTWYTSKATGIGAALPEDTSFFSPLNSMPRGDRELYRIHYVKTYRYLLSLVTYMCIYVNHIHTYKCTTYTIYIYMHTYIYTYIQCIHSIQGCFLDPPFHQIRRWTKVEPSLQLRIFNRFLGRGQGFLGHGLVGPKVADLIQVIAGF